MFTERIWTTHLWRTSNESSEFEWVTGLIDQIYVKETGNESYSLHTTKTVLDSR